MRGKFQHWFLGRHNMDELIKCYLCHKPLLIEKVIEGRLQKVLHPERVITQFYLNNHSRMDVALCMSCKDMNIDNPIIQDRIMKNIIDGWQKEQDELLAQGRITKAYSDNTMAYHKELNILFKSEDMDDYKIIERVKKCPS